MKVVTHAEVVSQRSNDIGMFWWEKRHRQIKKYKIT